LVTAFDNNDLSIPVILLRSESLSVKTGEPQGKPCAVTIIDPAAKGGEKIVAFCFLFATELESDRE
jgi:hypothetical protein